MIRSVGSYSSSLLTDLRMGGDIIAFSLLNGSYIWSINVWSTGQYYKLEVAISGYHVGHEVRYPMCGVVWCSVLCPTVSIENSTNTFIMI